MGKTRCIKPLLLQMKIDPSIEMRILAEEEIEIAYDDLTQERDEYRAALEFYAKEFYTFSESEGDDTEQDLDKPWNFYTGKKAREVLAKYPRGEG